MVHPLSSAEHEPDHRYTIRGYILDESKAPIPSSEVVISADGTGARGSTDGSGYYSLRLHLHTSDLGRSLIISTDHGEGTVLVNFDPGDRSTQRIHHVNFVGGQLIEGELEDGGNIPDWVYYLLGLGVILAIASFLARPLKQLKKRMQGTKAVKKRKKTAKHRPKSKKRKHR